MNRKKYVFILIFSFTADLIDAREYLLL